MTPLSKILLLPSVLLVAVPHWLSVWSITGHGLWSSIFMLGMSPVNGWVADTIASF